MNSLRGYPTKSESNIQTHPSRLLGNRCPIGGRRPAHARDRPGALLRKRPVRGTRRAGRSPSKRPCKPTGALARSRGRSPEALQRAPAARRIPADGSRSRTSACTARAQAVGRPLVPRWQANNRVHPLMRSSTQRRDGLRDVRSGRRIRRSCHHRWNESTEDPRGRSRLIASHCNSVAREH